MTVCVTKRCTRGCPSATHCGGQYARIVGLSFRVAAVYQAKSSYCKFVAKRVIMNGLTLDKFIESVPFPGMKEELVTGAKLVLATHNSLEAVEQLLLVVTLVCGALAGAVFLHIAG
jgi:hypothetical protein